MWSARSGQSRPWGQWRWSAWSGQSRQSARSVLGKLSGGGSMNRGETGKPCASTPKLVGVPHLFLEDVPTSLRR
eukprot:12057698-Alexandrium_andersonii.AAC.1